MGLLDRAAACNRRLRGTWLDPADDCADQPPDCPDGTFADPATGDCVPDVVEASTTPVTEPQGPPLQAGGQGPPEEPVAPEPTPPPPPAPPAPPPPVTDGLGSRSPSALVSGLQRPGRATCRITRRGGGSFLTGAASGWRVVGAHRRPCRSTRATGIWWFGGPITVRRQARGELVCMAPAAGYGSDVWYDTPQGWIWSGATATPQWRLCS